jgi:hypothetical protein
MRIFRTRQPFLDRPIQRLSITAHDPIRTLVLDHIELIPPQLQQLARRSRHQLPPRKRDRQLPLEQNLPKNPLTLSEQLLPLCNQPRQLDLPLRRPILRSVILLLIRSHPPGSLCFP